MPVQSRPVRNRHIVVPLRDAPSSKYSLERRALCHVDAYQRFPDFPDVCPACQRRDTKLWLQVCYEDHLAGLWNMVCDNKGCRHVHLPEQVGPTGLAWANISALIAQEAGQAATQRQIQADAQLARDLERAQHAAEKNSKRAGKTLQALSREESKKGSAQDRARKQDAAANAAAKALRAKLASGDTGVTRRRGPQKKAQVPEVERKGAMLVWTKDGHPPTEHEIVIPANGQLDLAQHAVLVDLHFKFWVADEAAWVWDMNSPLQVQRDHTTVLVRLEGVRLPHGFPEQLHIVENIRGETDAARKRTLKAAQTHLQAVNARDWDVDHAWVTFWWKDYVEPRVWHVAYSQSNKVNLSHHDEIMAVWQGTGLPGEVDVWVPDRAEWKTYSITSDIPLSHAHFSLLVRLPDVDGLVNFPVELYALHHPHAPRLPFATLARGPGASKDKGGSASSTATCVKKAKNTVKSARGKKQAGRAIEPLRVEGDLSEVGVALAGTVGGPVVGHATMDLDEWIF